MVPVLAATSATSSTGATFLSAGPPDPRAAATQGRAGRLGGADQDACPLRASRPASRTATGLAARPPEGAVHPTRVECLPPLDTAPTNEALVYVVPCRTTTGLASGLPSAALAACASRRRRFQAPRSPS